MYTFLDLPLLFEPEGELEEYLWWDEIKTYIRRDTKGDRLRRVESSSFRYVRQVFPHNVIDSVVSRRCDKNPPGLRRCLKLFYNLHYRIGLARAGWTPQAGQWVR